MLGGKNGDFFFKSETLQSMTSVIKVVYGAVSTSYYLATSDF